MSADGPRGDCGFTLLLAVARSLSKTTRGPPPATTPPVDSQSWRSRPPTSRQCYCSKPDCWKVLRGTSRAVRKPHHHGRRRSSRRLHDRSRLGISGISNLPDQILITTLISVTATTKPAWIRSGDQHFVLPSVLQTPPVFVVSLFGPLCGNCSRRRPCQRVGLGTVASACRPTPAATIPSWLSSLHAPARRDRPRTAKPCRAA